MECWDAFYLSTQQAEAGACLFVQGQLGEFQAIDSLTGVGVRGKE